LKLYCQKETNFNILLTDIAYGYPQAQEDDNQKHLEGINHQGCHNAFADAWREVMSGCMNGMW